MIRSRQIAKDLELDMKIGDVEYQGDGNKAIFYYIADARVDFRKLIKVLAEEFHVRIEMKQIGARQEAGRIGGIGPCGRELCCATFVKNFNSVSTAAARFQDISPNPQKLAGQCAKLKCCLNYEVDAYVESFRKLPSRDIQLETADATYYFFKADILSEMITYSTDKRMAVNLETISATRAHQVIEMNKRGEKPLDLNDESIQEPEKPIDLVEQEDLTRFDKQKKKKKNNRGKGGRGENNQPKEVDGATVNAEKANISQGGERNNQGRRDNNRRRGDFRRNGRRHDGGAANSGQKQGE
jgi:cell fate regulator YaaT (PSP1 superfamily)